MSLCWLASRSSRSEHRLERETGIEPATNSLEGCDSTTELLPPSRLASSLPRRFGGQARLVALTTPRHFSRFHVRARAPVDKSTGKPAVSFAVHCSLEPARWLANRSSLDVTRAEVGGEGRTRTFEATGATDLQSAAFDRFATSPTVCNLECAVFDACPAAARLTPGLSSPRPCTGAGEGIRTPDLLITNQLLYRPELRQPTQKLDYSTSCAIGATGCLVKLFLS